MKRIKKLLGRKSTAAFDKNGIKQLLIEIIIFIAMCIIVVTSVTPKSYNLKVGDIAPTDIKSPKDAVNTIATNKLQEEAASHVSKKFTLNHEITEEIKKSIQQVFKKSVQIRSQDLDESKKFESLKGQIPLKLTDESIKTLLVQEPDALKKLGNQLEITIDEVMSSGIKEDELDRAKTMLIEKIRVLKLNHDLRSLGEDLALTVVKPNMLYDKTATEKAKWEAINSVEPVEISKGEVIIQKGHKITQAKYDLLKELGLLAQDSRTKLKVVLGSVAFILLLQLVGIIYMYQFCKNVFESKELVTLVGLIMIVILMLGKGISTFSGYLIPVAAGSILIAILLNPRIAVIVNLITSILVGLITGYNFHYTAVALVGGSIAVFSVSKVSQRSDLTRAGLFVAAANVAVIGSLSFIMNHSFLTILKQSSWGIINGIFSAVLAIGFLPFLESAFGITSSVKLLELSNPNHPLLKKLLVEAPGTYHHSIIVGNLAEGAAEEVGGDPLLARAGAFYHDIGKIKRPYFFIENQLTDENPHDKISPSLSSLIIISHVKDGLETAKKYKLPKVIRDIIAQHHGTTVLNYFYQKALDQDEGNSQNVTKESFTYEGPKPQTKEAAIVMLADSVEAAIRSMGKLSKGKIEGTVREIIKEKLDEGQLDQSDLTLKDLDKIASVFSRILSGIFHTRIEYPKELSKIEGGQINGSNNKGLDKHNGPKK